MVPLFISHLALLVLSFGTVVLTAAITGADFPTYIVAWIWVELVMGVAQTLYAVWAIVVDTRDTTFYERKTETFFIVDCLLFVMNIATAVTGAVYWRNGEKDRQLIYDASVVLVWFTLVTLALLAGQDRAKMNSS